MQKFYQLAEVELGRLFPQFSLRFSLALTMSFLSFHLAKAQCNVQGGIISTTDPTTICANDGQPDPIDVDVMNATGDNTAWIITDDIGNILALPAAPPFDLNGAGEGVCLIWHLSYNDGLSGLMAGNHIDDLSGCYELSNDIPVTRLIRRDCRNLCGNQGGYISTTDPTTICAGDGVGDPIDVSVSGGFGTNAAWVITDDLGNILALPPSPPFDLDGAGPGVCLIWYLRHEDDLTGLMAGNNVDDLDGCFGFSNPIAVTRNGVNGGMISTNDPTTICAGDGIGDPIDVSLTGTEGSNQAWIITDDLGNILALPPSPPFDLDGAGPGVCLIWNIAYEDGLVGLTVGNNAADLSGCYDLSNAIEVTRNEPEGGMISTNDPTTICAGDGNPDPIFVELSGASGANTGWIITDDLGNILALPASPPFDLEGAGGGLCLIWNISYEDGLMGLATGNNVSQLAGCYDLSNAIEVQRNIGRACLCTNFGGFLDTDDPTTICAGDGIPDPIYVDVVAANGSNFAWVITDNEGNILALPPSPPFDFEGAGPGICLIWHLAYEDDVTGIAVGNNAADLTGCYDLSDPIAVTRLTGNECPGNNNLVISGNTGNELQLYPNPVTDVLNVNYQLATNEGFLSIYHANGSNLYEQRLKGDVNHTEIDLSNYPEGYYLIRIQDGEQVQIKKIIVTK